MVKYYRLSNIVNGGKKPPCSTSWDLVPKLYPNSLGHKYVNYYKNVTSRYGWRSNIDTLNLIINRLKHFILIMECGTIVSLANH